jgi:hypothetical protein
LQNVLLLSISELSVDLTGASLSGLAVKREFVPARNTAQQNRLPRAINHKAEPILQETWFEFA